jgi:gliding motility-associated-like protein
MIWARYDGIWAYYPDSTTVPLSQKSYLWSTGDTTSSITVQPSQTTKYKITRTSGGFACTDSILVSVLNMQTALQQNVTVCADSLKLDAGIGFKSYSWNTGDTSQSIIAKKNGTYTLNVTKGSCSSKDSSQVQLASAVLDFIVRAQKDSVCVGESDTLNVINPQAGVVYSWYLPGSAIKINSGLFYGLNSVSKNVSYIINATSIPAACAAKSASVQISIRPKIEKPILRIDSLGATAVVFSWNSVPNAIGYLISLNNGLDYQDPANGSLALKELVNGIPAGQSQKIIIKALGQATCQISDTSQILATTINPFGNGIYIPNAFTPNGDGVNDVFRIYGTAIKTLRLKIYSQWGEMIFSSTDLAVGWDGNSKGNKSPASVYHFTLDATMQDGTDVIKTGIFTLIR